MATAEAWASAVRSGPRRGAQGLQGGLVGRLLGDLGDDLHVSDRVRSVDDEDGPRQERDRQAADQDAVISPKLWSWTSDRLLMFSILASVQNRAWANGRSRLTV